jgi:hypothetical protein
MTPDPSLHAMNPAFFQDENAALTNPFGLPEGMIEHSLAQDIHALVCLHGFEEARRLVAEILLYEADRRPTNGNR